MKIYLAGPEVFLADAREAGRRKLALCRRYGFEGMYPLDNEIEAAAGDLPAAIFTGNIRMIHEADGVVANLSPFRGVSADVGTVFEVGHAFAAGKLIYGYSTDPRSLLTRTIPDTLDASRDRDGRPLAQDGMAVEDFGLAENLMVTEAIRASGGVFVQASSRAPTENGLALFESCLKLIAERTIAMPALKHVV